MQPINFFPPICAVHQMSFLTFPKSAEIQTWDLGARSGAQPLPVQHCIRAPSCIALREASALGLRGAASLILDTQQATSHN